MSELTLTPLQEGLEYRETIRFSQKDVEAFAEVTGDRNPIHLDETYAAGTLFKRPIIHGMITAALFSRVLGTKFPGEGTIYMNQSLSFKKPMYVEQDYEAVFRVKEIIREKNRAIIETSVLDKESGSPVTIGEATVMNLRAIR